MLLEEGKYDKAEVILDLAMKHMPVEYYDYYSLLEPFIIGYFEIGETEKAMELWEKVATKYQENLIYYSGLDRERQYAYGSEIITDIERYRSLLTILLLNAEEEVAREKSEEFEKYQQMFQHFYGPREQREPEVIPEQTDPDLLEGQVQDTEDLQLDSVE